MRRSITQLALICGVGFALCFPIGGEVIAAETFEQAITLADLDVANCQTYQDGVAKPADPAELAAVLGLEKFPSQRVTSWSAGPVPREAKLARFHYILALKRSVPLGSLLLHAGARRVAYLKGAELPKTLDDQRAWVELDPPARQAGARLFTFEPGFQTRAIRVTDERRNGRSEIEGLRLLKARWQSVTPAAMAYAGHEYTPPRSTNTQAASLVTTGRGYWASSGKDDKGLVSTPAITDINPEWFLLAWDEPQTISGLWLLSNISTWSLEYFVGPQAVNPRVGTPEEWRKVRNFSERFERERSQREVGAPRWIAFDQPLTTRGLRINILKTSETAQIASIHGLHVFTDLQSRPPLNLIATSTEQDLPPYRIAYEISKAGNLTLAVNDHDSRRARNLITRRATEPGKFDAAWDLKDEEGNYVAPGEYQWSAITMPTLQTRYEFTVYPNVSQHSPENAPWLTGTNGPGGWMADHTPPLTVCAAGNRVYLGSLVAESGVSLIECDLTGKKLWAHHSFAAWTGPKLLASDGKTVFVGAPVLNEQPDNVWTVDIANKQVGKLFTAEPTAERQRGQTGLAVRGGELYMAVNAKENWLVNAAAAEDLDLAASYPRYRPPRKPRFAYEVVPDPQLDFVQLLRLVGSPPGKRNDGCLTYLQSQKSAASRQHIVAAFHRAVPLGSVALPQPDMKDVRVELSFLKPSASYPPFPEDDSQWLPFKVRADDAWDVIAAPEGTMTRALRITLVKGEVAKEDDLLAKNDKRTGVPDVGASFDLDKPKGTSELTEFGQVRDQWQGRLEGLKLMRRRFHNVFREATVRVNSGKVDGDGRWDAERDRPLTAADPGIYMLEWKTAKKLRGLALKEVDGKTTKVDVYTGPAAGDIDLAGEDSWENVADYQQVRRSFYQDEKQNSQARYLDGYVDFGREVETRAVRLRVIEQWPDNGPHRPFGVREDQGGLTLDPARCRVFGVAALEYLGGEPVVDRRDDQRIEVYSTADGKLLREIMAERPGRIAFNPGGELLCITGTSIVKIDQTGKAHQPLVTDCDKPVDLAFDARGQMYVFDGGPDRKNVRVYDSAGQFVRSIGKPGGLKIGPWDPERMGSVTDIEVDAEGQLWVVENQYFPKRVTLWSTDGTFRKELLGNTAYGGGGVLNPWDKTQLFYGPLEFELNWQTGQSRLKNLTTLAGNEAGEVPIRLHDRTYLVTRPQFATMQCGIVYLYEKDHLKLAAAMGLASTFSPLKRPELIAAIGGKALNELNFNWSDRNGNGQVDAEEVQTSPGSRYMPALSPFNRDLSTQAGATRYEVKEFLANGVPIYEAKPLPQLQGNVLQKLDDGNFFRLGNSRLKEAVLLPDGRTRWTYPNDGEPGVQAPQTVKPWTPEQIAQQFGVVGHETAPRGDLGEFIVIHTNSGEWNIWTSDGLLVGPLFRDLRDPQARPWSMREHERSMVLEDITVAQEHFAGYVCRSLADDKIYAIAGHNHISVLEVQGLEEAKRYGGKLTITAEDVKQAQAWDEQHEKSSVYQRAPVVDCFRLRAAPAIDGKLDDWGPPSATIEPGAQFRIGYTDAHLYVAYKTSRMGPLKNSGTQWDRMFKSGACVNLQLGVDPAAPLDRMGNEPGDLRLLMSWMQGKPIAVIYRPVVPGTPKDKQWRVVSPVGQATFDEVKVLEGVELARSDDGGGYMVEAAIPLAAIGLKPAAGLRLKLDWGLLTTGPDGNEVLRRIYWANQATSIVADAPSEARLQPHLWGFVRFHDQNRPSAEDQLDTVASEPKKGKEVAKDVDDILDTLKEKKGK